MTTLTVRVLTNVIEKSIGLIGAEEPFLVFFTTRFGIHTFGIQFPIDILILDPEYRVVKMAHQIKPNRIFIWSPVYYNVIELPAGEISRKNITIGTRITIKKTR